MKHLKKTILISLISLLLGACGQTGPLYLPDQAPPNNNNSTLNI